MHPLEKVRVLDFSTLLPGPFASMYLADWGAEVVRIESPEREDMSRLTPPFQGGVSTTHAFLNRSKKSVVVDLKSAQGLEKIRSMIVDYDILLEQFRPGVMAKLGLSYEDLKLINPRLIYVSITGYGQTGPYRDRAGHDINYAALSGLSAMTGTQKEGPVIHGNPVCDLAGSMHALFGLMVALYSREKTGQGQYLDVSITESSLMFSGLWAQMAVAGGVKPSWESTLLNGGSFYGYYRTKDHQFLSIGGLEPKFLKGFLEAIDALDLLTLNLGHGPKMREGIQQKISLKNLDEWTQIFGRLDVCVEPVLGFDRLLDHPQFLARSVLVDVPLNGEEKQDSQRKTQTQKQLGSPLKFSEFRPIYRCIGVPKGAHGVSST